MKEKLHIFKSPEELADQFADELMNWIECHSRQTFHLAISGGKTPNLMFSALGSKYADSSLWQKVHFWWVDERMVPPVHPESNFGVAQKLLFSQISIPEENIHRIKGENDPEDEAHSYSTQIQKELSSEDGWPVFDLILLGMGDDGHTASIFPNQTDLLESPQICAVATHPNSGQKRVTLTGKAINNAKKVCFLVTGSAKSKRIAEIFNCLPEATLLPAGYIKTKNGAPDWYLDESSCQF
jgi:6-phosphogluconolactonase